ncbi:MAG: hypothetical protein IKH59_06005 [Bacteroidaceae bacterium]|nr:hypothetical protein [Bacteroidaceae bacterium]
MKRKSFLLKKVAAFAVFFISVAQVITAQEVQVLLRPKMDPMPPQVMNYIGNPGTFFDVSLTNTSDEVQNVFLTLEVSKQTGGELSVTTPYFIQPNKAITLVPKRLTMVDQVTLLGQFRQLLPKDITLRGAEVSDFYDNGVVGLLPEGTYQAQVKVYKWDPAIKYPQLVSDPMQGKCTFNVCYNASAPEILVPLYNPLELKLNALEIPKRAVPGMASDDNDAKWQPAILDPVKAQFVWTTPVINCGGKVRSYKYQLDIYPIGTTQTSAEEAVATGTIAKTVKNLVAAQCILSEAEVAQMKKFSPTGYFVARVTATPTVTDKNNADYSTIENNGHSQLLVFRLKQQKIGKDGGKLFRDGDLTEAKLDTGIEEENVVENYNEEVDPGYKEPEENDNKKFVYSVPKLTAPTPFKGNVLKENDDLSFKWEKPIMISGDKDTLRFCYNVSVFKKTATQSIDSLLVSKPLFSEKSLTSLNYTLRWDSISKKIKLNDNIVVAVLPVCLNEASVGFEKNGEINIYRGSYVTGETGKLIDCDPEAGKSITNRELAKFSEKELRDMEVMVGQFPLTIENANLIDGDHYEGHGYITWKPMGDLPFQINVTFSKLYINSDRIVYDGEVVSAREEEKDISEYIPYDMFDDLFLSDLVSAGTAEAYGDKLFEYIENDARMATYCGWARDYAPIIDDVINQKVSVNLPVNLNKIISTCPIDIQIMSGRWSPTNASVSIIGMFALNTSDYTDGQVAVFGLPRLCIDPDSFIPESCTMALLSDFYIKDPVSQYVFTLKAPSDLQKMDDGCTLSFTNKGFKNLHFEADMEIPGLIKANEKGERIKGVRPHIEVTANIDDWDKWIGKIRMDNFEIEEAPGFTFVPTGGGVIYDHHPGENDLSFSFPEPMTPKGGVGENFSPKIYNKSELGINSKEDEGLWQGLYMDEIGCYLPPIFKKGESDDRIEVKMKQLLWDKSGLSLTIAATGTGDNDLVGIETGKLGGWGISLHEVGVSMVQGEFGCTYFTGMVKAPLIGGKWKYSTSFDKIDKGATGNELRMFFSMKPDGDPKFDFFLAELKLEDKYTHLDVLYTPSDKEQDTKVELEMAGHVTIAGTEELTKKLDFSIPGIAFTGMRLANFANPKKSNNSSDVQDMIVSHTFDPICEGPKCWFELGTWGLASEEKTLGPFKFSLDNFGVDKKNDLVGVNIVGTIGLVSNVFSATAGVTVWAKVDLDKLDISYKETTLADLGLSTEFGGCRVAGSLKFVDKDDKKNIEVKGYSGTLEIRLPGDLFKMQAAGGFYNAKDSQHGKFTSAYFLAELGGASGIPIGPVQLNNIMGGFFFHTALDMNSVEANETDPFKWKTSIKYGTHGGMFGLGISTVGTDRGLKAKVKMTVLYDAERNRLSTFRMTGDMHALCVAGADDGMINGKCCIVYQNMPQNEGGKYFQINVTADAGGDMDKLYEQFTGQKLKLPECVGDLQEMGDQGNQKSKDAKDTKPKVSCGVSISLDFKVTMKPDDCTNPNFKSKWHLYVGQPGDGSASSMMKDRCSITFIDFQVGGKKDKVAAWCKIWANAYLCIGNELPNNGQLPPIPQEIDEFLNGSKKDDHLSESSQNKSATANEKRKQAVSQFDGSAKSGVMFGAQVGGDFGVRAVICYAEATLLAGFDVVLKQLEDAQCNGKRAGGKGGFYGMGQVYAMAKGEMGLIIDLWIYKGDWSLISVGVGALLKGGFPNPSWMYGKVKAKCKLFGGLIKFTGSLTFETGDVCFPDAGNPLDDIKIFEDMTPGEEHTSGAIANAPGWRDDPISVFAPAGFTTNMKIGTRLDLVDENTANRMAGKDGDPAEYANNAMRSYKFYLEPQGIFESWTDKGNSGYQQTTYTYRTSDQETYEYVITGGMFAANRYYKATQKGYCKEIRNGKEVDPVFNDASTGYKDKNKPWTDEIVHYFRTGALPNNLMDGNQIAFTLPQKAGDYRFYENEMNNPQIHLRVDRASDDIFNPSKYDLVARFEKEWNGIWIPVDAVVRVDTYKDGNDCYYVDENGNIDYTIKVNSLGEVIETQVDPFVQKDNQRYYFTYGGNQYNYTGANRERVQRFTVTLSSLMESASQIVDASKTAYYYPLKWIPTGFNSLEKAIDYYRYMINSESSSLKGKLSTVSSALTTLENDLKDAMKNNNYPTPNDDDIRYIYQGASSIPNNSPQVQERAKNSILELQKVLDEMQRCLNDGEVYITQMGKTTTYKNRHQLTPYWYELYIENYDNKVGYARRTLENGFRSYPTSSELNELKSLYLQIAVPYSKIKADYNNVAKIKTILESVNKERDTQKTTMTNIRSSQYSLSQKKTYLSNLNNAKKNKFEECRKQAGGLYPEYCLTLEIYQKCDAFADSVAELTKYVDYLENSITVKNKANELEKILKDVNTYMENTPEVSRSYSYVKSNFYDRAISAFKTAKSATNHGAEFDRARTAYNSIESAIFGSEKLALDFAKEKQGESNSAYNQAKKAASDAIAANDATVAERQKTSSSNDNADRVNQLKDKEEKAFAKAYELANEVGDIAASVKKCTARHTGELNQTSAANQMRQIVDICQENAQKAMEEYKKAIASANSERLLHFWRETEQEYKSIESSLDKMIQVLEVELPKIKDKLLKGTFNKRDHDKLIKRVFEYSDKIQKAFEKLDECVDMGKGINEDHSYYFQMAERRDAAYAFLNASDYLYKGMSADSKHFSDAFRVVSDYSSKIQSQLSKGSITSKDRFTESVRRNGMEVANKFKNSIKGLDANYNTSDRSSRGFGTGLSRQTGTSNTRRSYSTSKTETNMKVAETNKNVNSVGAKAKATYETSKAKDKTKKTGTSVNNNVRRGRSTVPGVAEAFELENSEVSSNSKSFEAPETPETPDGPTGAAVVAKVTGMMNATLPKPKPTIPAESVIKSASAMLNGTTSTPPIGSAVEAVPEVPTVNNVSGPPADAPYAAATNFLKRAYDSAGKTATANSNTAGTTMHVDATSLANSKLSSIPVRFNNYNNQNEYEYLSIPSLKMYDYVKNIYFNYDFRVVIMQVDKMKFQQAQLQSKKETETTTEKAELDSSNKTYLQKSGSDGTDNKGDSYSLQAYMANYYKEMEEQGLQENTGKEEKTKLQKQKIDYTNFANEIYIWNLDFKKCGLQIDFASWAENFMKADATSISSYRDYLDNTLEGVRPIEFAYYNDNYSPSKLVMRDSKWRSDSELLKDRDFFLKDPYVWLAYMGSYALFNGKTISAKSGYWDNEFGNPNPMTIEFDKRSSPYRYKTVYSIGYSDRSEKSFQAASLIQSIGVGYISKGYDKYRAENINMSKGRQNIFTAIDDIKGMLKDMHQMASSIQDYYKLLCGKKKDQIHDTFSQWNTSNEMCGTRQIKVPAIQVGFVYQSQWLTYNRKGVPEYKNYFPGYLDDRYADAAEGTALSHQNYFGSNWRFNYQWYCNNMKYVKHEFYRCNLYNVKHQFYTMWDNKSLKEQYTKVKTWDNPLKGYGDQFTFDNLDPAWK